MPSVSLLKFRLLSQCRYSIRRSVLLIEVGGVFRDTRNKRLCKMYINSNIQTVNMSDVQLTVHRNRFL